MCSSDLLVVKGIQTAEDAALACRQGVAGVVVSNHGGRQLDGVAASLDVLPEVVETCADDVTVLFDGGVRRGTDLLMALALGATAVGIGRPVLWGLAVDGEDGVGHILDLLFAELDNAMALSGVARLGDLTPELLA